MENKNKSIWDKFLRSLISVSDGLTSLNTLEFFFLCLIFCGGLLYHWDPKFWGPAYIGNSQYGDAEFWWNGAIHFSIGIFADNPGRGYRPGYFIFTGISLAALGDGFFLYHKFFLTLFL